MIRATLLLLLVPLFARAEGLITSVDQLPLEEQLLHYRITAEYYQAKAQALEEQYRSTADDDLSVNRQLLDQIDIRILILREKLKKLGDDEANLEYRNAKYSLKFLEKQASDLKAKIKAAEEKASENPVAE